LSFTFNLCNCCFADSIWLKLEFHPSGLSILKP
jgi:hypothetical protein